MTGFTEEETGVERGLLTAEDGRVALDAETRLVTVDGEVVDNIVGKKLELLSMLLGAEGILPAAEICEEVWGEDSISARQCLNVHLMGLRRCLGAELGDADEGLIETVKKFGYRIRQGASADIPETAHLAADDRVAVDPDQPSVWVDRRPVDVTPVEYRIARELTRRPDRLVGISTLIRIAHGGEDESTILAVQNHVKNLRRKIGAGSAQDDDRLGDFRVGAIRTGSKADPLTYFAVRSLVSA